MRERDQKKLTGKISRINQAGLGETLYFRAYQEDDKILAELGRATGEKKSDIARKLIHLALKEKEFDFTAGKEEIDKLDWLINHAKHQAIENDARDLRLERLEEHARELETNLSRVAGDTHLIRILVHEIYCGVTVCVSYLNQVFTKLIEYFSPVEFEKKNSADFANRNILGLIEHAVTELEKLSAHHELELQSIEPEMLYLFTKIETLKKRLHQSLPADKPGESHNT